MSTLTISPTVRIAADRLRAAIVREIERSPRGGPMVLAIIVGLMAGVGSVAFGALIDGIDWFFFDIVKDEWLGALGGWRLMLIPALGAVLVGPITQVFAPEARGHGVPEVMLAVETRGGRIRPRVAAAKSLASALTIGSGGSVGKEGPIVQIGSALGSSLAQSLRLSEDHTRLLVACGAAGGVAATFNAPIAGVFFALEVILRRFNTRNFSVVVLASVVATATAVAFRGDEPAIHIPEYGLEHAAEIPLYALLGVFCAVLAVIFIRTLYGAEDLFERLPFPPLMAMPVVGGLLVGALALLHDGVLGLGEEVVEEVLRDDTATRTVGALLLLKLAATSITIGSGGSGGVFRPSLFLGAMAGGAFGAAAHAAFGDVTGPAGAYATVGMAAMFAGTARAPITAILIIFEMTRDYPLMLPLMTAVVAATLVSQILSPGTVYTIKLARRGVHLSEDEDNAANAMHGLRVSAAMSPVTITVAPQTPFGELVQAFRSAPDTAALLVDDEGAIVGVVTNTDVHAAIVGGQEHATAGEIATRRVHVAYPDESLHTVLGAFARRGVDAMPVVDRDDPRRVLGMIRRSDVTLAYSEATDLSDSTRRRRLIAGAFPQPPDEVRYLEIQVRRESGLDGKSLADITLPPEAVIVAVRHEGTTLIPRGHTPIRTGDRLTIIAAATVADAVRDTFERGPGETETR